MRSFLVTAIISLFLFSPERAMAHQATILVKMTVSPIVSVGAPQLLEKNSEVPTTNYSSTSELTKLAFLGKLGGKFSRAITGKEKRPKARRRAKDAAAGAARSAGKIGAAKAGSKANQERRRDDRRERQAVDQGR
jgi:hypothetical protein